MTTLLRRLAERAVRAASPSPVTTVDGLEVVDDERAVAAPSNNVATASEAQPTAARWASLGEQAPDAARRDVGDAVVQQRSVAHATSRLEASTPVVAAAASVPAASVPATSRPPATQRRPGTPAPAPAVTVAPTAPAPPAEAIVLAVPVSTPVWPARPLARRDDAATGTIADDGRPTVQVRIGRLDVRAVPPAPSRVPQRPEPERDASAELALSDYLRGKRAPR